MLTFIQAEIFFFFLQQHVVCERDDWRRNPVSQRGLAVPDNAIPLRFSMPLCWGGERGTAGYGRSHSGINLAGTREAAIAAAAVAAAPGDVSGVLLRAADYTAASLSHARPHWKVDDRGELAV